MGKVTVRVPMNIALVKYWGKRNEELILPLNDSISLTVDDLFAETTVELVSGNEEDKVEINGRLVDLKGNRRYERVFKEALRMRRKRVFEENGDAQKNMGYRFHVSSTTNFPVAAGLASSAAGFAAIALAIKFLFELDDRQANRLARLGSGSACRSMYGGLVQWRKGSECSGSDCIAEQVCDGWNTLTCIIVVLNDAQKKVGSSEGMRRSAETSELLKCRISKIVDERIRSLTVAYEEREFDKMAQIIMADSNQFHAICMDTQPPIRYMNESSWKLIELVESFNSKEGIRRAAYTFDAGPNACVIVERENVAKLISHVSSEIAFPKDDLKKIGEMFGEISSPCSFSNHVATRVIVSSMGAMPSRLN